MAVFAIPVFASETQEVGAYSDNFVKETQVVAQSFNYGPTLDGYCVSFVQQNGFEKYRGNANIWINYINSFSPVVGAALVLSEGEIGHLALVIEVGKDYIEVAEQNYEGRGIVSFRTIPINYNRIIGYVLP